MTGTIAAISGGNTASGIGIVRISGPEAFSVLERIFIFADKRKKAAELPSQTVHYGHAAEPLTAEAESLTAETSGQVETAVKTAEASGREIIDEALVIILRGPRSYTGEDTAEIDCHGGPYVMQRILGAALKAGARLAEPGEFTKRAFLNGRIDLTEAEAVMDVIEAGTADALKSSVRQLRGSVRNRISSLRETLILEIAQIEAALDDPEHISLEGYPEHLAEVVSDTEKEIRKRIRSFDGGRFIREGIRTVILGKPNTGKSSFLNVLAGEDRAIVTDIPGTTRDALEETVRFGGLALRLADTAGIRDTEDPIEKIGVEKATELADGADLLLLLFDRSRPPGEEDKRILSLAKGKKAVLILNKEDLDPVFTEAELQAFAKELTGEEFPAAEISAKEETGLAGLEEIIRDMFLSGAIRESEETVITNIRHKEALAEAEQSLIRVRESLKAGMPEDFYSIDLMDAYAALGRILGEEVGEDLIDTIFSRFCMGK